MSIWAIADLHLSFGVANKKMDIFGEQWREHADKIAKNWKAKIANDDLVLIAGDISWAMRLEDVAPDLSWIDQLPGTKVMIRGNHDYWWHSISKIKKILPPSIHVIQNDAFGWNHVSVGGARMWDTTEFSLTEYLNISEESALTLAPPTEKRALADQEKIFVRELGRLELSLKALDPNAELRIVMTHYPPISATLEPSRISALLEKYQVDICVFGHIHNAKQGQLPFGETNGVRYLLTACDYLEFDPVQIG